MANSTFLLHFTTNDLLECIFRSNPPTDRPMNFRPHRPSILYTTPLDLSPRVPAPVAQRFVFIRHCKSKERRWLRSHNREFTVETEFPPKVQAKRASNSETSCWFLRVERKRIGGGRLPKERIERIFAAPRINSTVNIYSKPTDIIFVQILGMLSTIDDRFKMIRVLFASNLCCEFYFSRGNFMFDWNCIL